MLFSDGKARVSWHGVPSMISGALAVLAGSSLGLGGCATDGASGPPISGEGAAKLGEEHAGQYHLGPVDFAESEWHNACAPAGGYRAELRPSVGLEGEFLAGVSNELSGEGAICDACLRIETNAGKSIVARIVTYGVEQEPGDIDVSPSVFDAIHQDEYPRSMRWSLIACPSDGPIVLEFKSESNPWWTSLWVRNANVPLERLSVRREDSEAASELTRESDGSWVAESGFGEGAFTLSMTSLAGQVLTFDADGFEPGRLLETTQNFEP